MRYHFSLTTLVFAVTASCGRSGHRVAAFHSSLVRINEARPIQQAQLRVPACSLAQHWPARGRQPLAAFVIVEDLREHLNLSPEQVRVIGQKCPELLQDQVWRGGRYGSAMVNHTVDVELWVRDLMAWGLTTHDIRAVVLRQPKCLEDNVHARLEELTLVLPGVSIQKLLRGAPGVISYNSPKQAIGKKLEQLEQLLPGVDTTWLVKRAPTLLTMDIEGTVGEKVKQLKQLLPGVDMQMLVKRAPCLLYYDIQGTVGEKMRQLGELLPGVDVVQLVRKAPSLLTRDIEGMAAKMRQLGELLPGVDVVQLVKSAPTVLQLEIEGSLGEKMRMLGELLPGVDVVQLVKSAPYLLCRDIDGIGGKMRQLGELLPGVDVVQLVRREPTLLYLDIEGSLSQKVSFLKQCVSQEEWDCLLSRSSFGRLIRCSLPVLSRINLLQHHYPEQRETSNVQRILRMTQREFEEKFPKCGLPV